MNTQIRKFLAHDARERDKSGWHLYEWDETQYLVFFISDKRLSYGAAIRLEPLIFRFVEGMEYTAEDIGLSETGDQTEDKRFIKIQAEAENIWLHFKISKYDVVKKVTFVQRILIGLSILYLALIPVLYLIFRILFISPLLQLNEAHRQMEAGNGEYRIKKQINTVEFRNLYQSFNRMADSLCQLKIESY